MINNIDLVADRSVDMRKWKTGINMDLGTAIGMGVFSNMSKVYKFGRNATVAATTLEDINTPGGLYEWPQAATNIEVVSDSADDTGAGTGARVVKVFGLDANWLEIDEEFTMNGLTPVVSTKQFLRIHRAKVTQAGAYSNKTDVGNHAGDITIRDQGGAGTDHIIIDSTTSGIGVGQSVVARYTIPAGKRGFLNHVSSTIDGNKETAIYIIIRENNEDLSSPPYATQRVIGYKDGVTQPVDDPFYTKRDLAPRTDIWIAAYSQSAAKIEADFEIIMIDE